MRIFRKESKQRQRPTQTKEFKDASARDSKEDSDCYEKEIAETAKKVNSSISMTSKHFDVRRYVFLALSRLNIVLCYCIASFRFTKGMGSQRFALI